MAHKGRGHGGAFAGLPTREKAFILAEAQQEGGYDSVNSSSGALGRWQVLPSNVAAWTKEALGRSLTPDEYLHSHAAQNAVARVHLGGYFEQYGLRGAASAWYSGNPSLKNSTAPVAGGPSIKEYTESVKSKTHVIADTLRGEHHGSSAGPIVAAAPGYKAPKAARQAALRLWQAGLRGHDLVLVMSDLWAKTGGKFNTTTAGKHTVSQAIVDYKSNPSQYVSLIETESKWRPNVGHTLIALKEVGHKTPFTYTGDDIAGTGGPTGAGKLADEVSAGVSTIPHAIAWFFDAGHVVRILFVIVGLALIIIGLQKLTGETAVPVPV